MTAATVAVTTSPRQVSASALTEGLPDLHWFQETGRMLAQSRHHADLFGYINPLRSTLIQIIDQVGLEWLYGQTDVRLRSSPVFSRTDCMVMIMCDRQKPNPTIREICREHDIGLAGTSATGDMVGNHLQRRLPRVLSPRCNKHGVFVAIMNTGVLITGASGVGKSEVALDLVQRGHQLIADDSVIMQRTDGAKLRGSCAPSLKGHIEIRGLGIINVEKMFGPSAVLDSYPLQLIVNLKDGTHHEIRSLDRLQPSLEMVEILGVSIPCLNMLVAPGRNLSVLVEAATRDHLLRKSGVNSSVEFISRHDALMGITSDADIQRELKPDRMPADSTDG